MKTIKITAIFIVALTICLSYPKADEVKDIVDNATKDVELLLKQIEIPKHEDKRAKEAAAEVAADFYSKEFQDKIRDQQRKILKSRSKIPNFNFNSNIERIYIFVSSSMPRNLTRSWITDVSRINTPGISFVLRGTVDGSLNPMATVEFIRNIMKKDEGCELKSMIPTDSDSECEMFDVAFEINPPLYRRFKVQAVPCIVYEKGEANTELEKIKRDFENDCDKCSQGITGNSYKISGAMNFKYMLDKIFEASGSPIIHGLSRKLEDNFYNEEMDNE
ncbi:MAG: hypothetical protein GY757_53080 [bacterium]|nr:hypothetical protein [bacterium]